MSQDLVDRAMNELHLAHVIATGKVGPAIAEAIPHLQTAITCWGEALRSQPQADALVELGKLYQQLERYQDAVASFERAVGIYKELGDRQQVAYVGALAGLAIQAQGNCELALGYLQRALAINRDGGDLTHVARTLMLIAGVHKDMKNYAEALKTYQEALEIFIRFTKRAEIAHTHQQMAMAHLLAGNQADMAKQFELAATAKENVGDVKGAAQIISKFADVERDRGKFDAAMKLYNRCLSMHRLRGDQALIAQTLGNIGIVHALKGEAKQALDHYEQCLELSEKAGERASMAMALFNIGCLHVNAGKMDEALKPLSDALALCEELDLASLGERVCTALMEAHHRRKAVSEARIYRRKRVDWLEKAGMRDEFAALVDELVGYAVTDQQWGEALDLHKRALAACRDQGGAEAANRHYHIGLLLIKAGDHPAAVSSFEQAMVRLDPGKDAERMANVLRQLGNAELHIGAAADARAHALNSLELFRKLNDKRGQAQALVCIGNACAQLNLSDEAKTAFDDAIKLHEALGDEKGTAAIRRQTDQL